MKFIVILYIHLPVLEAFYGLSEDESTFPLKFDRSIRLSR